MKKKAIWNGVVIAESDDLVNIEGNYYFPESAIRQAFFKKSDTHTHCHWKGEASYYTLEVEDRTNADAAWYYPEPKRPPGSSKGGWRSGKGWKGWMPEIFVQNPSTPKL